MHDAGGGGGGFGGTGRGKQRGVVHPPERCGGGQYWHGVRGRYGKPYDTESYGGRGGDNFCRHAGNKWNGRESVTFPARACAGLVRQSLCRGYLESCDSQNYFRWNREHFRRAAWVVRNK